MYIQYSYFSPFSHNMSILFEVLTSRLLCQNYTGFSETPKSLLPYFTQSMKYLSSRKQTSHRKNNFDLIFYFIYLSNVYWYVHCPSYYPNDAGLFISKFQLYMICDHPLTSTPHVFTHTKTYIHMHTALCLCACVVVLMYIAYTRCYTYMHIYNWLHSTFC